MKPIFIVTMPIPHFIFGLIVGELLAVEGTTIFHVIGMTVCLGAFSITIGIGNPCL